MTKRFMDYQITRTCESITYQGAEGAEEAAKASKRLAQPKEKEHQE